MADEKKISAKEAGIAVLKKFGELLTKAEKEHKHIGWDKLHGKLEREGYSKESADKIAGSIKAKVHPEMKKDEGSAPPAEGQTINSQIGSPFGKEEAKPEEQKEFKGHIKLAKFIGHIQGKRSAKAMPDSGNNDPTKQIPNVAGDPNKKLPV